MNYLVTNLVMILSLMGDFHGLTYTQSEKPGFYAFDAKYADSLKLESICLQPILLDTLSDTNSIMIYCVNR